MTFRPHATTTFSPAPLRRAVWLWLALLLALFGALAPTVSHALASSRTSAGMEVCTSMGMQWVDASGALDASSEQPLAKVLVDCPMCLLCADQLAPVPASSPWSLQRAALGAALLPSYTPVTALAVGRVTVPPPRGPPSLS
ncbi:MAG: DUF2946 family protein [Giesbergeria sp.]